MQLTRCGLLADRRAGAGGSSEPIFRCPLEMGLLGVLELGCVQPRFSRLCARLGSGRQEKQVSGGGRVVGESSAWRLAAAGIRVRASFTSLPTLSLRHV